MKKQPIKTDIESDKTPLDEISGLSKNTANLKVPEGYFDALPGRVLDAIQKDQYNSGRKDKIPSLFLKRKAWIPLLAAASLLIAYILFIPGEQKSGISGIISDSLNQAATYDASYASDLLTEDLSISEHLLENMPEDVEISFEYTFTEGDTLVDEAILDYLENQELDTELLAQLEQ